MKHVIFGYLALSLKDLEVFLRKIDSYSSHIRHNFLYPILFTLLHLIYPHSP